VILAVDASAIVALALEEPEQRAVENCLLGAEAAFISPINLTEAGLALVLRDGRFTADRYLSWLESLGVEPFAVESGEALRAYLQYGKGVHRAGLNLGDCFAYALAKALDAPLLYKGGDFALTDVRSALQPT
jgi:ribonuclease VapC